MAKSWEWHQNKVWEALPYLIVLKRRDSGTETIIEKLTQLDRTPNKKEQTRGGSRQNQTSTWHSWRDAEPKGVGLLSLISPTQGQD